MIKQITNWESYSIDERGIVYSSKKGWNKLKPYPNPAGYLSVGLYDSGKHITIFIHTLVLVAFSGKKPKGMECRHLNGNKENNNLYNLKWGTKKENGQDKINHGNSTKGERNRHCKLNSFQVRVIRFLKGKITQAQIAYYFPVNQQQISYILSKNRWKHI